MLNIAEAAEHAWVATRVKALLTEPERTQLAALRAKYAAAPQHLAVTADPHLVALCDGLLA